MSSKQNILNSIKEFQNDEKLIINRFNTNYENKIEEFISNAKLAGALVFDTPQTISTQKKLIENTNDYFSFTSNLGVAENGALWCSDLGRNRDKLFLTTNLILQIDKKNIVDNMAQAYEKISLKELEFGTFISGPSKTADIEQSLVLGAHGAMSLSIFIL